MGDRHIEAPKTISIYGNAAITISAVDGARLAETAKVKPFFQAGGIAHASPEIHRFNAERANKSSLHLQFV